MVGLVARQIFVGGNYGLENALWEVKRFPFSFILKESLYVIAAMLLCTALIYLMDFFLRVLTRSTDISTGKERVSATMAAVVASLIWVIFWYKLACTVFVV